MASVAIGIFLGVITLIGAVITLVSLITNIDMKGEKDDDNIFKP